MAPENFRYTFFATAMIAALLCAGCERGMRDMYEQPRTHADDPSQRFADGRATRTPETHTVAHATGDLAEAASGSPATKDHPGPMTANAVDGALSTLERGQERYNIFCAPCHSPVGDGDGMVVRRGFPRPRSFHLPTLLSATDAELLSAIDKGSQQMPGFAARIAEGDRRAIVAYIRALQLSQHASLSDVPQTERARLDELTQ